MKHLLFSRWRYVLVAVLVLGAGTYIFAGQSANVGATMVVTEGDFVEQVSVSGTVTAAQDVALGFAANGRIAGVYARVGQHVAAGTVLAQIENGDLVATLAQKNAALNALLAGTRAEKLAVAEATVASAVVTLINAIQDAYTVSDDAVYTRADVLFTNPRSNPNLIFQVPNVTLEGALEGGRAGLEPMLADWRLLNANLTKDTSVESAKRAQANLRQVAAFLANASAVVNQGLPDSTTSAATLTSYSTSLATARSNVNAALTKLASALAGLTDAEKSLVLEQAGPTAEDIAVATAEVDNARANLAKTRVIAPFAGTITRMDAKVGESVSPTASSISLQSDGLFQIETYVPEVAIARVSKGNAATTTLDAYGSSASFRSVVVAVDPAETVRDGVPTYKTTLAFLEADPRIRSGMTANVVIQTGILKGAIVIPSGAITTKSGARYVSVVEDDKVEQRAVVTGPSPALGQAHILEGLSAGEVVLLSPAP